MGVQARTFWRECVVFKLPIFSFSRESDTNTHPPGPTGSTEELDLSGLTGQTGMFESGGGTEFGGGSSIFP